MNYRIKFLFLFFIYGIQSINCQVISEIYTNNSSEFYDDVNIVDTEQKKKHIKGHKPRHHCCCKPRICVFQGSPGPQGQPGQQGPTGPQGQQGPPGPTSNFEYAYIYSTLNSVIPPGGSVPFNQNGPSSSNISHSTVSNTDQIIINRTGVFRIIYNLTSSGAMYFAVSINGVIQTSSLYGTNTGGTILAGSTILSITSGDIIRITNYSIATTTTLSNLSNGNARISASITISQTQ